MDPRDRLIVALDAPDVGEAERLIAAIGDSARFYKIGMELAFGGGLALAPKLAATGKRVFVDLKLHDIPNTVERATSQIARLGAAFLTVHAYPQTMRAAVAGAQGTGLKLLAVSVLTSADDADLAEAGYALSVSALVERGADRRAGVQRRRGEAPARDGRPLAPAGDAGHPPSRRRGRRSEARRNADFGDRRRRRLPRRRPANHRRPRSARRRRSHRR
jgi:orotidine-5'-phosphate decarboxylase